MARVSLTFVDLLIDRDASTKLPTTVPEYELVILEDIYGAENVHELGSRQVVVDDFDAGMAYGALVAKYGGNAESDKARADVFRRERDLAEYVEGRDKKAKRGKADAE